MKENAAFTSNTGNIRNWLNCADLVVGVHRGYQNGFRGNRAPHIVGIDTTESIHRQVRRSGAEPLKEPARIDDSRMFHLRRDEVRLGFRFGEEHALQHVIVGFASPAGKDNLVWLARDQPGDLRACILNGTFCWFASPVFTGRIAERFRQDASHGIRHFGCNGRAGIEIQIYAWSFHRLLHRSTSKPYSSRAFMRSAFVTAPTLDIITAKVQTINQSSE